MNKTLTKMSVEYETRIQAKTPWEPTEPMRAALLWLADNVSDEMLRDMHDAWIEWNGQDSGRWEYCLKAALRAAAGPAPTTPEVK